MNNISNRFKTSLGNPESSQEKIVLDDMKLALYILTNTIDKFFKDNQDDISKNDIKDEFVVNNKENKFEEDVKSIKIESDLQYVEGNNFVAEGNVIATLKGKKLEADKFNFDKERKILRILGNIRFEKGNQFFIASEIEYDLNSNKGFILDSYGMIDVDTFISDLNLNIEDENKDEAYINNDNNKFDYIENIKRRNTNFIGIENRFKLSSLQTKLNKITRWRFKTSKINFSDGKFFSKKVKFSNDPFNKPQLIFESLDFTGELIEDKLKLSGDTYIILDDKLKIPIGRREIYEDDYLAKWGFGYDKEEKGGLFLYRNFVRNFHNEKWKMKLKPYFLIQRTYEGKTKDFVGSGQPLSSNKVESNLDNGDYFAIDMEVTGNINKWNFETTNNLNSLSLKRLNSALRSKSSLSRTFYLGDKEDLENNFSNRKDNDCDELKNNKNFSEIDSNYLNENFLNNFQDNNKDLLDDEINDCKNKNTNLGKFINFSLFNIYRNKVWRGFQGESEIYNAYGISASNRNSWKFDDESTISYLVLFDLGNYRADLKDSEQIGSLYRASLTNKLSYSYPIWSKNNIDKEINSSYKYGAFVPSQGLMLNSSLSNAVFLYSDGSNQNALSFNIGPVITLGSLRSNLLDYTKLNFNYNRNFQYGETPFDFDTVGDSANISLRLTQQIYGPLIFRYDTYMNLDREAYDYGEFKNPFYTLEFSRRAYGIEVYYSANKEIYGVKLNIYNFGYSGISPKF